MKPVEFVHTAYSTPVLVYPDQVIAIMYLPSMKSVTLVGPGSTAIPVVGELAEIEKIITAAKAIKPTAAPHKEGANNGIPRRKRK